jgi:ABC-type transport system involved in cytochrome bd biosynthesis fused ATPase/permease subunit
MLQRVMLNVAHLNVRYGVREVLRDVSFAVPEGKIVALLGGSGSGKTTILNTLTGLSKPRAGSIAVAGGRHGCLVPGSCRATRCFAGAAGSRSVRCDEGRGEYRPRCGDPPQPGVDRRGPG